MTHECDAATIERRLTRSPHDKAQSFVRQVQILGSRNSGRRSRVAFVSMMESAHLRKLYHRSEFRRLYAPRDRSILVGRLAGACPLVVFEIRLQDATQTGFMQDDDVVQALPPNRSDQSLNVGILPA